MARFLGFACFHHSTNPESYYNKIQVVKARAYVVVYYPLAGAQVCIRSSDASMQLWIVYSCRKDFLKSQASNAMYAR